MQILKIRLLSDLHLEFYTNALKLWKRLKFEELDPANEILVLAGDIGYPLNSQSKPNGEYIELLRLFRETWEHVILVPGNHEYYERHGKSPQEIDQVISQICKPLGVHLLQKQSCQINGVTFLGCTLWSYISQTAFETMNDQKIFDYSVGEYRRQHSEHLEWLKREISLHNEPIVIVSHHLPSPQMVHESYKTWDNSGYATNLETLMEPKIKLWLCGHTHESKSVIVNKTRVLCNPVGYPPHLEVKKTQIRWTPFTLVLDSDNEFMARFIEELGP